MNVTLLTHTPDPEGVMYTAFRTCYSGQTPEKIWGDLRSGKIPDEKVYSFLEKWLSTGHASPRTQIYFTFAVSGVSRSLSHQLVRHHAGISFDQQSQRYCEFKGGKFPFVIPPSVDVGSDVNLPLAAQAIFQQAMADAGNAYSFLIEAGVPAEDARFVLPNAAATNITFTANYEALLHIADLRLCTRAQWEIRRMWAKVRAEVRGVSPLLASFIQPKCGEKRLGYCDETREAWAACPIGKVRPHKNDVIGKNGQNVQPLTFYPLQEKDYETIEVAE